VDGDAEVVGVFDGAAEEVDERVREDGLLVAVDDAIDPADGRLAVRANGGCPGAGLDVGRGGVVGERALEDALLDVRAAVGGGEDVGVIAAGGGTGVTKAYQHTGAVIVEPGDEVGEEVVEFWCGTA
jgi:hypothetical protein